MKYFAYSQREFIYKYVVMFSDTDQFQHMSFANYLKLMFLSTDALLVSSCDSAFLDKYRVRLVDSSMQFKHQCVVGDNVLIKVNSTEIQESGFTLLYTFIIENTGRLVGLGRQSYMMLECKGMNSVRIPDQVARLLDPIKVDKDNLLYKY